MYVNRDSAIKQLERYRRWNTLWSDHNTSVTISWDISELNEIVEWLHRYWNDFVAVSWLRRIDPLMKPADVGYAYLPQEVVTEDRFDDYSKRLKPVDWTPVHGQFDIATQECAGGVCPTR